MADERHVTPLTASGEPEHILTGFCWCQPLAESQPTGGIVYIHRRSLDSPHIEAEPTTEGDDDG